MGLDIEDVNTEHYKEEYNSLKKTGGGSGDVPWLFLKSGITQVRILPPKKGSGGKWMRSIDEHFFKSEAQGNTTLTCPRQFNDVCPLCDLGEDLFKKGRSKSDLELIEQSKEFRPSTKYLANVICFSSPDPDAAGPNKGVQVLKFGTMIRRELLELDQDIGGWGDITNIKDGVNLRINRTGEGLNTRYTVTPMPKRTDLKNDLAALQIKLDKLNLFNLNELQPPKTLSQLKELLHSRNAVPGFKPQVFEHEDNITVKTKVVEPEEDDDDFDLSAINLDEED